jgi:hypothetical protein
MQHCFKKNREFQKHDYKLNSLDEVKKIICEETLLKCDHFYVKLFMLSEKANQLYGV